MTKLISILLTINAFIVIFNGAHAQAPQAIPYQAVARDNSGNVIGGQNISLRFSIRDVTAAGTIVYRETQTAATNALGLFSVNIGQGTPVTGTFAAINWAVNAKFIQVEMDVTGGTSYINMGTQQMLSVPYSLISSATEKVQNGTSVGQVLKWNGTKWIPADVCTLLPTFYPDMDGDGYGAAFSMFPNLQACNILPGYSYNNLDCNDNIASAHPNGTEIACDGIDNDCDGQVDEVVPNFNTDLSNCGFCNHNCSSLPHVASTACVAGICTIMSCQTGWANCDGNANNGCETNVATTSQCGVCNSACGAAPPHMIFKGCINGQCTYECATYYSNCDGSLVNGCEVNLVTGCAARFNAVATGCSSGVCTYTCVAGFADCDGNTANGCEFNLNSCPQRPNATVVGCVNGNCIYRCSSGLYDCNSNPVDGCEVDVATDVSNCGACGIVCPSGHPCVNGVCQ